MARESRSKAMLDAAEALIRTRGYQGVAVRDVADAVGVRTAAVHYHFPGKADLGEAVMRRYARRFFSALGEPVPGEGASRMAEAFRLARAEDGGLCPGAMLAAELPGLPEPVAAAASGFMQALANWLFIAYGGPGAPEAREKALAAAALLEGAMLVARASGAAADFELALRRLPE